MNNQININDQDLAVAKFLKDNHVHFSIRYMGSKKVFDSKHVSDQWLVKIGLHEFDFYTGIGHRLDNMKSNSSLTMKQKDGIKKLSELLGQPKVTEKLTDNFKGNVFAVAPTQASVLYCLLSDASCADQNFDDFCSELGYDADSMKDFKTYQACCEILFKMRKIFTSAQRHELSELLQDY
jgi:hypothetical protein